MWKPERKNIEGGFPESSFGKKGKGKNIILTGFMGAGKSTVGKILSLKLGVDFYDTDELIAEKAKMTITDIFLQRGEKYFRDMETEIVKQIGAKAPGTCVVATGGGVVLRAENVTALKENGWIVYLEVSPREVYRRLKDNKERPLLAGEEPLKKIEELMAERRPFYQRAANLRVKAEGKRPSEIADEILTSLKKSQ